MKLPSSPHTTYCCSETVPVNDHEGYQDYADYTTTEAIPPSPESRDVSLVVLAALGMLICLGLALVTWSLLVVVIKRHRKLQDQLTEKVDSFFNFRNQSLLSKPTPAKSGIAGYTDLGALFPESLPEAPLLPMSHRLRHMTYDSFSDLDVTSSTDDSELFMEEEEMFDNMSGASLQFAM